MGQLEPLLERASLLLEQGRYRDAETFIRQALEQDPENDYTLALLARCYLNNDQVDKGIEVVQQAISLNPGESFYYYLLGFGYYQKGLSLAAIDSLGKAMQLNPWGAEYFGLMAFVLLEEKRYEEALQKANEGLAADAENLTCLNARARALNKLKRTEEAVDTMSGMLAKDPDNQYSHATVGWNYFEKGHHKKANHHFREALRIDPNYESARAGLKESLKSNFLPYKLVVQFSLWMAEKSKSFRWIFLVGIYLVVRITNWVADDNPALRPFLLPLIIVYFLFLFFTWIANPLANFFLLFHKDGRYSLTRAEAITGIMVASTLVAGILLLCYAFYFFPDPPEMLLFPAIILTTLSIPAGHLLLPIDWRSRSAKTWFPLGLLLTGVLAVPVLFLIREAGLFLAIVYGAGLLIFTWVANAWD